MGSQSYALKETAPGVYTRSAPALVMVGHWGLTFEVTPPGKTPVLRPPRRPGQRMSARDVRLVLLAALTGLVAGAAACVVVVLLAVDTLG